MKLAFKIDAAEKKPAGRSARVRLTRKCQSRNRQTSKRLPAMAAIVSEEPLPVVAKEIEPAPTAPTESLSSDSLQLYLNEIGRVKLLTPEEELTLAKRVKRGDKKARERMITANLRLVVKIARDYEGLGLPLLDLINEGNIGLMKGVERFDPKKGAKLSYYASWWIKQSMMRALANQSKTIRLPVHVVDKMAHIRRAEVKLREVFGHEPTDEEIADHLGLNTRRIQQYRDASKTPVSLDAPLGHDEPKPIAEVVADANAAAPFDRLVKENDNGLVREALATLDTRESRILAMRFGLDNGTPKTLEEIAVRFDVTRERIRQIQDGALKKMRIQIEEREAPVLEDSIDL
jgi:RNA polymerase primary sigma factor